MSIEKKPIPTIPLTKLFKLSAEDPLSYFMSLTQYGDIVKMPLSKNKYLINSPTGIQRIFTTNFDNYTKVGTNYRRLKEALGPGLLTNSNSAWAKRRQDLQPMLYYKNLAKFTPIINQYTQDTLDQWEKHAKKNPYFNIANELLVLVAKISATVLFGLEIPEQIQTAIKLVHIGNSFIAKSLSISPWFPSISNLRFRLTQKKLHKIFLEDFSKQMNPNLPEPLLYKVVQEYKNKEITTEEFLGDVKNFFVAGHETTGNALAWSFYCLFQHPDKLIILQNEIDNLLAGKLPTFDDLPQLKYCEMVLEESMRLYPPIWIIERKALADDELDGYFIPAESIVIISPYTIHRHPNYWENPNLFFPERFLPENSINRNKNVYIPFGTGPRVCIGKQLAMMISKIILPSILQRFDVTLAQQQKVKPQALVTLRPKGGIWVKIVKK